MTVSHMHELFVADDVGRFRCPGVAALSVQREFERCGGVRVQLKLVALVPLDRRAARRALVLMETAALVRVSRKPDRAPVVEILNVEATAS